MAGQIVELARRSLTAQLPPHRPAPGPGAPLRRRRRACSPSSAPSWPPRPERALGRLGIEVHLDAMVTDVDEHGLYVRLEDGSTRRFGARTTIWAAGVRRRRSAPPWPSSPERELDRTRPRRGAARLLAARPPRGVRGRRPHDAGRPARASPRWPCSRARHAARIDPEAGQARRRRRRVRRSATATSARWPRSRASGGWPRSGRSG